MINIHQLSGAIVFCLVILAACASSSPKDDRARSTDHNDGRRYFESGYMHR